VDLRLALGLPKSLKAPPRQQNPSRRRQMNCRRISKMVAITYKSAMDDPSRIAKSKAAGALFGLTPKKYQSGEKDVTGGITRTGDEMVRTALYEAANVLLSRITRFSKLKRWGMDVAKRRGSKRKTHRQSSSPSSVAKTWPKISGLTASMAIRCARPASSRAFCWSLASWASSEMRSPT
jgi:Transposase IS116/IS110/IS902 family